MKAPWNQESGFQALTARFIDSAIISAFASQLMAPNDVLGMLSTTILATVVFWLNYTKCHALPARDHNLLNAWDW